MIVARGGLGVLTFVGRFAGRGAEARLRRLCAAVIQAQPLFALPERVDKPPGTRVLVVAAHADDEAIGCGGTILRHHQAGDRITAVFMTNGVMGNNLAQGLRGQALIEAREREAREAAERLGIQECVFLGNPDGALRRTVQTVGRFRAILAAVQPDIVYVPSPLESHCDHREACMIAAAALAEHRRPLDVYLCEVWSPVPANCAVPIDLEKKIEALRAYRSQMDERELYVTAVRGLAAYRGITCVPGDDVAVECFLRMRRAAFVRLAKKMG